MNKPPTCTPTAVQMIGRNLWEISIKPCLVSALCLLRPYENIFNRSQYWLHIFLTGWDCVCFDTMGLSLNHFFNLSMHILTCLKGFQFHFYLTGSVLTFFLVFCFFFPFLPHSHGPWTTSAVSSALQSLMSRLEAFYLCGNYKLKKL